MEVDYYKKLFQTIGNIIELIEKDDIPKYLLFLENAFPYMDNYNYHKGMNGIIQELTELLKTKNIGTDSDRALLLDFQATLETKPEKAIKLEKDALAQIETITADNARLVSNLHANLGGLYLSLIHIFPVCSQSFCIHFIKITHMRIDIIIHINGFFSDIISV